MFQTFLRINNDHDLDHAFDPAHDHETDLALDTEPVLGDLSYPHRSLDLLPRKKIAITIDFEHFFLSEVLF
jgi:hypothetical protein